METEGCEEFCVGFCTFEEFYVENLTKKCPHSHIRAEREAYTASAQAHMFEYKVLGAYKEILSEVDRKMAINRHLLTKDSLDEATREALLECESLLDLKSLSGFDFEKTYNLLFVHGKLVELASHATKRDQYEVCDNCSAFKKREQKCSHNFCSKYQKLRRIAATLESKLIKAERSAAADPIY